MLKKAVLIVIFFFPLLVAGQTRSLREKLLSTAKDIHANGASVLVDQFEQGLKKKTYSSDRDFLQAVFIKTHQKFLRHFISYADMSEVFSGGKYDCLSATSLFSIILSDLNFQYRIVETNYHIFLIVQTTAGDVLLETTDRYNGFVSEKKEIEKRVSAYKQNALRSGLTASSKMYHTYHFSLYQDIKPEQLAGLLYYNQAVKAFNQREFINAADLLEEAQAIYASPRVAELAIILVEATLGSDLSDTNKLLILERYKTYWEQRSRLMAVNSR